MTQSKTLAALLVLAMFLTLLPAARADEPLSAPPPPTSPDLRLPQYYLPPAPYMGITRQLEHGRHMRIAGTVLTAVGIGLGALSAYLLYDAGRPGRACSFDEPSSDCGLGEALLGVMTTVVAVGTFIPGIVLYTVGSAKEEEAKRAQAAWSLTPSVGADYAGARLTVRF
jgi:hypothetical protein